MREWLSGRASPCQGERREFESRLPLHLLQDKRRKNMRLLLFVSGAIASGKAEVCKTFIPQFKSGGASNKEDAAA